MEFMRRVVFKPYASGSGPRFALTLYYAGTDKIPYRLNQIDGNKSKTIFQGNDFRPSPLHSIDSDEAVKALMGFLTLRKGDTDREYFDSYTPEQLSFSEQHAESLACAVYDRFGQ